MVPKIMLKVFSILALFSVCSCQSHASTALVSATPQEVRSTAETSVQMVKAAIVFVPRGKPQAIDGTISQGEWDLAVSETFPDNSELLMMYSDGYLYVGIRANTAEMIVGNIHLNYGDEISILHASAALGTAIYQKQVDDWQQLQGFSWCCRSSNLSETNQAEMNTLLENDHWLATNSRIGTPNEIEYQIEIEHESIQMAVNYIKVSEPNLKIPWPSNLNDDCIKQTPGGLPDQMHFSPDKWVTIVLQVDGDP